MEKILNNSFNKAVIEIENFLLEKEKELNVLGWSFKVSDNAPESFKDLKESTVDKCIVIAGYGCENTIYSTPHVNHVFRFYHDHIHLTLNKGFSKEGEISVINQHMKDIKNYGVSNLALNIFYYDTFGQVEYYFKQKQFVINQRAFIESCLQHGLNTACRVKH